MRKFTRRDYLFLAGDILCVGDFTYQERIKIREELKRGEYDQPDLESFQVSNGYLHDLDVSIQGYPKINESSNVRLENKPQFLKINGREFRLFFKSSTKAGKKKVEKIYHWFLKLLKIAYDVDLNHPCFLYYERKSFKEFPFSYLHL